jgi:hypothetical protein
MTSWRGTPVPDANVGNNSPPANLGQSYARGLPVKQWNNKPWTTNNPGEGTGVPGKPVQNVSGNPGVASVPYTEPPDNPYGQATSGLSQFGQRPLGVGQESAWRGGAGLANDKLITRDRHLMSKVGNELTGRDSGFTDPPMDGPARPSYKMLNRSLNYQYGTDNTANLDDRTRPYARNAQGMYMGEQGSGWNKVYGGTPGLWQPYGSYAGITNGPVQGIQASVSEGAPGDGSQSFFSGPPHGLHSPTMPAYSPILGYYMSVPQMRAPRVDRPSNSPIGGQSFSQLVVPQGQTGTVAQQAKGLSTNVTGGVNWAASRVSGWRGQAGAGNAS